MRDEDIEEMLEEIEIAEELKRRVSSGKTFELKEGQSLWDLIKDDKEGSL